MIYLKRNKNSQVYLKNVLINFKVFNDKQYHLKVLIKKNQLEINTKISTYQVIELRFIEELH